MFNVKHVVNEVNEVAARTPDFKESLCVHKWPTMPHDAWGHCGVGP